MKTPEDLTARRGALLASVRYVRTPEGADHFGQPIGAVITEDVVERTAKATVIPEMVFDMPESSGDAAKDADGNPVYLYRAVSEEEWQQAVGRGFIQTDGRMNLAEGEGTVTADRDPSWYLPNTLGSRGRIVRIQFDKADGWWRDTDGYWKSPKKIPLGRVDAVTPLSLNGQKDPSTVTPRHVGNDIDNQMNNAFIKAFPHWDGRGLLSDFKDAAYALPSRRPESFSDVQAYVRDLEGLLAGLEPDEYSDETPEQIRSALAPVLDGARRTVEALRQKTVTAAADSNSTGTVIVAIPTQDDEIWSVSSEPKPHMTMIWLGKDVSPEDLYAIRAAVADAADQFAFYEGPQELAVTSREPLGDDKADVLMLDALRGPMERLRDYMASHEVISRVMATAEQYPTWTPHCTIGYPDAPATGEPGPTIRFDRIGLWDGNYEGAEFSLTQSVTADATSNQWQHRDQHGRWLEMSPEAKRLGAGGSLPKAPQITGGRTDRVKVPETLGAEAPLQMTRISAGEYVTADGEYALSLVEGTTWRILLAKIRQRLAGSLDYPSYEDARIALAAMLRRGPAGLREANQMIMADIRAAGRDAQKQALLAAVRHVRTPEGAARYGQPIGSVITADRTPKANLTKALPDGMTMEQYLTPHTVTTPKAVLSEQPPGFEHAWLSDADAIREINETVERTIRQVWPDLKDLHIRNMGADDRVSLSIRARTRDNEDPREYPDLLIKVQRKVDILAGTVHNEYFSINWIHQGEGFASALTANLEDLYRRRGVVSIQVGANIDVGGYAWAKLGFDFNMEGQAMAFLRQMKTDDPATLFEIDTLIERENRGEHVTPIELAMIGYDRRHRGEGSIGSSTETWFGKEFLLGTSWGGRKTLYTEDPRVDVLTDEEWKSLLKPMLDRSGIAPEEVDFTPVISEIKDKVHAGATIEGLVVSDVIKDEILAKHATQKVVEPADETSDVDRVLRHPTWDTALLPGMRASREGLLSYRFLTQLRGTYLDGFAARAWSNSDTGKWTLMTKAADDIRAALYVEPMEGTASGVRVEMNLSQPVRDGNAYAARRVATALTDALGDWLSDMRRHYGVTEVQVRGEGLTPDWLRTHLRFRGYEVEIDDTGLIRFPDVNRTTDYKGWTIHERAFGEVIFSRPGTDPAQARNRAEAETMIDLIHLLGPVEAVTAGLVRHVRTPEGEKKYGQPIGSIITADREVKAHLPAATAKWRDLNPGDRFIDAEGATMEVISLQSWESAEAEAFHQYAMEHSGVSEADFAWDADLAAKAKEEWLAKRRHMVVLAIDGRSAGHWSYAHGVANPEYEFTRAPSIGDPFEAEIVAPARAAMQALAEKYPDGVDQALSRALHMAPPEPKISDEMKRLWRESVAKWEMVQLPKAREEADAAEEALQDFARAQLDKGPYTTKQWEQRDALVTRRDAAVDRVNALLSNREAMADGSEGDVARYYRLEKEHQAEYAAWLATKNDLTPTSPEALAILADIEAVGAIVRKGIRIGVVRAEAATANMGVGLQTPSPTREGVRRQLSRRAVAALRGHAETTNQKWLTDFDMTKLGAERGLHPEEKTMLTESLLFYPKDWVTGFDRLGQVTTDKSRRGYFGTDGVRKKTHHISLSDAHNAGVYDGSDMQATAVHEVGHGMERVIPGLTALEMIFWYQRTGRGRDVLLEAFDGAEMPRKVVFRTNREYTLKYYGKTVKSRSTDRDEQKMYTSPDMTTMPDSWEIFTTGVQEVLGSGWTDYTVRNDRYSNGVQDTELWDLTMGALLSLPGTPGQPLFSNGTMKVEEVQPTMAPKMITDQELITAAHPSTKSKRYYRALYSQGDQATFAVASAEEAQRYAREYGIRFLGGQTPVSVKWSRDDGAAADLYQRLRREGSWTVADRTILPGIRRLAARDGFTISQSTERDYMGRPTYHVSLVDPENPMTVARPDGGA